MGRACGRLGGSCEVSSPGPWKAREETSGDCFTDKRPFRLNVRHKCAPRKRSASRLTNLAVRNLRRARRPENLGLSRGSGAKTDNHSVLRRHPLTVPRSVQISQNRTPFFGRPFSRIGLGRYWTVRGPDHVELAVLRDSSNPRRLIRLLRRWIDSKFACWRGHA